MKRIIITGATGLIGSKIALNLISRGDEVVIFSRSPEKAKINIPNAYNYVHWNYDELGEWQNSTKDADAVIHLAGENLMGSRWTNEHKRKVIQSRKLGTQNLVNAICQTDSKCKSFVCASAIGFYNNDINLEVDENSQAGSSFLAEVSKQWEEEAVEIEKCGVRRVSIRIGIVLSKDDGALAKMLPPFQLFIGGPLGSGLQWFPWIHIDDIANLFIYSIDNNVKGVLNGVAPNNIRMREFAKTLGKVLHRPAIFKVPEFILKIVLGDAAETVTKGSKVIPKKTLEADYKFKYNDVEKALNNLLK